MENNGIVVKSFTAAVTQQVKNLECFWLLDQESSIRGECGRMGHVGQDVPWVLPENIMLLQFWKVTCAHPTLPDTPAPLSPTSDIDKNTQFSFL